MRSVAPLLLAAALTTTTQAISFERRQDVTPKVIHHEIARKSIKNPLTRDRLRRRSTATVSETLDNEETLYYANVSLGTPAQSLRLHIDTGSSDLWVNTPNSQICEYKSEGLCSASGTYTANSSSTYTYLNSLFTIEYADGSGASGDYATDNFNIGGTTIKNQQFAIGYQSTSEEGIVGIGYMTNEASLSVTGGTKYANVPQQMLNQGLIGVNAYSLWLNDLDASTGSILFGGVDTGKFSGTLEALPIVQTSGVYTAFYIALTGVGANGTSNSIASGLKTAVLLDSGSSLTYLPNDITTTIFTKLGVTYNSQEGAAIIDCARASDTGSIDFTFSTPTISVSMAELVIPIGVSRGKQVCILGIAPAESSTPVLGDTFLRSAYVVYDLTNNQIALAQTDFNSTTTNIAEITNGTSSKSGIPNASVVSNAVTSVTVSAGSTAARNGLGTSTSLAAAATMPPATYLGSLGAAGAVAAAALFAL